LESRSGDALLKNCVDTEALEKPSKKKDEGKKNCLTVLEKG